jgi:hypothetical protein
MRRRCKHVLLYLRAGVRRATLRDLEMAIPHTQPHLNALFNKYTITYFKIVPGVYGLAAGNYTSCAMNSTTACGANWKALDGGAWFAKKAAYSQPNGDYTPGCWLGLDDNTIDLTNGFVASTMATALTRVARATSARITRGSCKRAR